MNFSWPFGWIFVGGFPINFLSPTKKKNIFAKKKHFMGAGLLSSSEVCDSQVVCVFLLFFVLCNLGSSRSKGCLVTCYFFDATKKNLTQPNPPSTWKNFIINFNLGRRFCETQAVWRMFGCCWPRVFCWDSRFSGVKSSPPFWRKGHWAVESATWRGILSEIFLSSSKRNIYNTCKSLKSFWSHSPILQRSEVIFSCFLKMTKRSLTVSARRVVDVDVNFWKGLSANGADGMQVEKGTCRCFVGVWKWSIQWGSIFVTWLLSQVFFFDLWFFENIYISYIYIIYIYIIYIYISYIYIYHTYIHSFVDFF